MILDARLILLAQRCFQIGSILAYRIENAALALHPALVAGAENAVEELMRNHLRRQGPVAAGPAQIALNTFTERFLADTDLERPKTRLPADARGDHLVDGRPAGAAAGKGRARHQGTHRAVMVVARTRHARRRIIETRNNMDIVAERRERREARRQLV